MRNSLSAALIYFVNFPLILLVKLRIMCLIGLIYNLIDHDYVPIGCCSSCI